MDAVVVAVLQSWTFDPWRITPLLITAGVYTHGWRWLHRRIPQRFSLARLVAFLAGLLTLFLALASPLDVLTGLLLQIHMTQHVMLMMVAPPLLLLGVPMLPLLRGLPRSFVKGGLGALLAWPIFQRTCHRITHPVVCWTIFVATNVSWHVPRLYELALRSEFWHGVQHFCFFGTALLFWWPVVQPWPSRPRWPRWALIPYLLLADLQNTALSAFLIFSERVLYPTYAAVPRLWGISVLDDQATAGVLMWVPGSIIFLVPVGLIIVSLLDTPPTPRKATAVNALSSVKMSVSHRRFLLSILFISLLFIGEVPSAWGHHGGEVRLMDKAGPFLVTLFTDPTPLRVGPAGISVLVQDGDRGRPILGAEVTVRLQERESESPAIVTTATRTNSINKLLYSTLVEFPHTGFWELTVEVQQRAASARVACEIMVTPPQPWVVSMWPYWVVPLALVSVGTVHWLFSRRRPRLVPLRVED